MTLHQIPGQPNKPETTRRRQSWALVVLILGVLLILTIGIPCAVALWRWAVS